MSRRSANATQSASLFPFLDVLVCTMGCLILLMLGIIHHGEKQVRSGALTLPVQTKPVVAPTPVVSPPPPLSVAIKPLPKEFADPPFLEAIPSQIRSYGNAPDPELVIEQERLRQRWRYQVAAAELEREQKTEAAEEARSQTAAAFKRLHQVQAELKLTTEQLAALEAQRTELQKSKSGSQNEQDRLRQQVAQAQRSIELLKRKQATAPNEFAFVPYDGASGTTRRPLYVECTETGFHILPEDVWIRPADLEGCSQRANPLLVGMSTLRDYWRSKRRNDDEPEPYLLLIVRPNGTIGYYVARKLLSSFEGPFGYELVGADTKLTFGEADAAAKAALKKSLDQAYALRDERVKELLGEEVPGRRRRSSRPTLSNDPEGLRSLQRERASRGAGRRQGSDLAKADRPRSLENALPGDGSGNGNSNGSGDSTASSRAGESRNGKSTLPGGRDRQLALNDGQRPATSSGSPGNGDSGEVADRQGMTSATGDRRAGKGNRLENSAAISGRELDDPLPRDTTGFGADEIVPNLSSQHRPPPGTNIPMGRITGRIPGGNRTRLTANPFGANRTSGGIATSNLSGDSLPVLDDTAADSSNRQSGDLARIPNSAEGTGAAPGRTSGERGLPAGGRQSAGIEGLSPDDLPLLSDDAQPSIEPPSGPGFASRSGSARESQATGEATPGSSGDEPFTANEHGTNGPRSPYRQANGQRRKANDTSGHSTPYDGTDSESFTSLVASPNPTISGEPPTSGGVNLNLTPGEQDSGGRHSRDGKSWTFRGGRRGIGLQKKIEIQSLPDRLLIGPDNLEIPVGRGESQKELLQQVVGGINVVAQDWGAPPSNFHWAPTLQFKVYPGGNQHYERVQGALREHGLPSTVEYALDGAPQSRRGGAR